MRRPSPALAFALVLFTAVGCSSDKDDLPSVDDFRAGDCRTIAPDVLTIGRDAGLLGTAPGPPRDVRASLRTAQDRIRALQPSLEPDLTAPVDVLVVAVGVVRLRSDSNGYAPSLGTELATATETVLRVCTQ